MCSFKLLFDVFMKFSFLNYLAYCVLNIYQANKLYKVQTKLKATQQSKIYAIQLLLNHENLLGM